MATDQKEKTFLCDEMLAGLGKWLRAAGYDTLIVTPGTSDRQLLECAIRKERLLLTRDRTILERKGAADAVFLLKTSGLKNWVITLKSELGINWLYRPFTRCLLCNGELEEGAADFAEQVPDYVLKEGVACFHCPDCGQAFWEGGHAQRMRRKLEEWQAGE